MSPTDPSRPPGDMEWSERKDGARTEYTVTPSKMGSLPYLVGAGLWDSFLIFFFIGGARDAHTARSVPFLVLPVLHALVGAFVTWLALVKTLNWTRLTLDGESLVLTHGPIPQRGSRFDIRNVARFDVSDVKGDEDSARLQAVASDGQTLTILLPFEQRDCVRFVASKLNGALTDLRPKPAQG